MNEIEIWVVVDENGDYAISKDRDDLHDAYESDINGNTDLARRVIRVRLNMPLPKPLEISGTVPSESEAGVVLTVK